jgi:hypothetical protein
MTGPDAEADEWEVWLKGILGPDWRDHQAYDPFPKSPPQPDKEAELDQDQILREGAELWAKVIRRRELGRGASPEEAKQAAQAARDRFLLADLNRELDNDYLELLNQYLGAVERLAAFFRPGGPAYVDGTELNTAIREAQELAKALGITVWPD